MDLSLVNKVVKGTQKKLVTVEAIVERAAFRAKKKLVNRNDDLNNILSKKSRSHVTVRKEN